ncbi:nucleotidyltransferase family protein [Devosia sp. A449]
MSMPDHLRFSGASAQSQREALEAIIRQSPVLMGILRGMQELALPDMLLGSGAIYNSVWNALTGRPPLTGIKDADVVYFDDSDLSYEAEDAAIQRAARQFAEAPIPVELRNQARVHLWFPQKFGSPYPQLKSSAEMLGYFASRTHAVAVRLEADDSLSLFAPFGLDDIFAFRITPNPTLDNAVTHASKAARAVAVWSELTVVKWPV